MRLHMICTENRAFPLPLCASASSLPGEGCSGSCSGLVVSASLWNEVAGSIKSHLMGKIWMRLLVPATFWFPNNETWKPPPGICVLIVESVLQAPVHRYSLGLSAPVWVFLRSSCPGYDSGLPLLRNLHQGTAGLVTGLSTSVTAAFSMCD